jgi:hypothetical protein
MSYPFLSDHAVSGHPTTGEHNKGKTCGNRQRGKTILILADASHLAWLEVAGKRVLSGGWSLWLHFIS